MLVKTTETVFPVSVVDETWSVSSECCESDLKWAENDVDSFTEFSADGSAAQLSVNVDTQTA